MDDEDPLLWGTDPGGWWYLHLAALAVAIVGGGALTTLELTTAAAFVGGGALMTSGFGAIRGGRALNVSIRVASAIDRGGIDAQRGWAAITGVVMLLGGAYWTVSPFLS